VLFVFGTNHLLRGRQQDNSETCGRSADVFSSGCFFLEILRIYVHSNFDAFQEVRRSFGESGHLTILFSTVEEVPGADGSYMNRVRSTNYSGASPRPSQ